MVRVFRRAHEKIGQAPGTLEYLGEQKVDEVRLTVWDYDQDNVESKELACVEECLPYHDTPRVSWINIEGLHDTGLLGKMGEHYGLHPLVMEDIVHTNERPKVEDQGEYLYIALRMLNYDGERHEISSEQLSLLLGPRYVLTFQERAGDVFDAVRERLKKGSRLRLSSADYLAYALLDEVVDRYFVILEAFGEDIEALETDLVEDPSSRLLERIHALKRELIILRKAVWPLREVVSALERSESDLIASSTKTYLRDLYDHTIQVIDGVESYRDLASGMQELYLSSISNKMNEVMKVLTVIATIFIPLTFLAGIYGMNFEFMPELKWKWSYPLVWTVIVALGGSMAVYFKKKGWI